MSAAAPRVVVVTRETPYERLLARHATRAQAAFWLETRGRSLGPVEAAHTAFLAALRTVKNSIPGHWRRARVKRPDLSRFLFEPGDTVVAVGQDGLVANVAKYLDGQPVVGINPAPDAYDGILVPHAPERARDLVVAAAERRIECEARTMVQVRLNDGQSLVALNEIFIGHRTHQSARYRISHDGRSERHSSSGLIVATGTGATGWARSIHRQRRTELELPAPTDPALAFLVREAFPSVATATELTEGRIQDDGRLSVCSELDDDGVIFGDGIEDDRIDFGWGATADIGIAPRRLQLVR